MKNAAQTTKEEKGRAHNIVSNAIKKGILVRPENCSQCFQNVFCEAHHPDYDEPLNVIWLCRTCHKSNHIREKNTHSPIEISPRKAFRSVMNPSHTGMLESML